MLHVQRFSGKMHEGLNSGCIQVGNLDAQGQLWEGELLFGVFLSVLLEFAPCVWLLVTECSNDTKEKFSSAFHMYLS